MTKTKEQPDVITVTLEQLTVSQHNVRAHSMMDEGDLDMLAASIASVGLLQPLVVIDHPETLGAYEIVAGARRFAALQLIKQRGVLDNGAVKVPVKVIDPIHATEASLAENRARVQMTSVELYVAFRKLADEGMGLANIARAFGYDEARVGRILRLAQLHPSIMKAWTDGDLSEKQAQAFAITGDAELQDRIATELLDKNGGTWNWIYEHDIKRAIKRAIEGDGAEPHVIKFVGVEAYEAAGGSYERDLFSDDVMIKDPALLTRLADEKADRCMVEDVENMSRADGGDLNVEWVDEAPQINRYGYNSDDTDLLVQFETGPLSSDAAARVAEIEAQIDGDDNDDLSDDEIATLEALEEERDRLLANDDGPRIIPAGKGRVVLVGEINRFGGWTTRAFYADRDAAGLPPLAKSNVATTSAGSKVSPAEQDKKDLGTSRDGYMAMQVLFADTVAGRLMEDADRNGATLGLDALLFGIAWGNRVTATSLGIPVSRAPERGNHKIRTLSGEPPKLIDVLHDATWLMLDDTAAAWDAYCEWIGVGTNRTLLGASLLSWTWSPLASAYREERRPKFVQLVAEASFDGEGSVGVAEVMPRVAALQLMSHKARVALLNQWGLGDHAKGLKKDSSAAFVEKVISADAEQRKLWGIDEETGAAIDAWLPSELAVEPVARPAPEPKADKPKAKGKAKPKKELADA